MSGAPSTGAIRSQPASEEPQPGSPSARRRSARHLASAALFATSLGLVLASRGSGAALASTLVVPVLIFLLQSAAGGLPWVLAFYGVLVPLTVAGVGLWQQGRWATIDAAHFALVSLALGTAAQLLARRRDRALLGLASARQSLVTLARELDAALVTDPVTGLQRRRLLDASFVQHWRRADRYDLCVAFFVLELDHFASLRQRGTPSDADAALRTVAEVLQASFQRPDDLLFRLGDAALGGLVLSNDTDRVAAHLDGVRREVEARALGTVTGGTVTGGTVTGGTVTGGARADDPAPGNAPEGGPAREGAPDRAAPPLTLSVGLAVARRNGSDTARTLYRRATLALRRARAEGRNRVVVDTPPLSVPPAARTSQRPPA